MLNDKTGMQTPVGSGNYRKYNPVSSTKKNYEGKKKGEKGDLWEYQGSPEKQNL